MVIMHAYEVQIYYAVLGVLKRRLKLAVRDGRLDWTPSENARGM